MDVVGVDKVRSQDQPDLEFHEGDILDRKSLEMLVRGIRPDGVVHLAARVDLDEHRDLRGYAANIDGVRNILTCVKNSPTIRRVIVTSSQCVCKVGYVPKGPEDYCPSTLYGQSKVATEQITREMDGGGKTWCLVRPTTVWGPGMSKHYQNMLALIRKGRFFHCGRERLYKSYSYAGNIASQYLKLLLAAPEAIHGKVFFLADYEPLSLRDYINGLASAMKAPPVPTVPIAVAHSLALVGDTLNRLGFRRFAFNSFRLRNILTEYQFDLSPTREVCGELPYSFEEGVRATAEWFVQSQSL